MSGYVVDASVAAKWFLEEKYSEAALALLDKGHSLCAPDFFILEMNGLVCKWVRRKVITVREGREMLQVLRKQGIRLFGSLELEKPAFEIATETDRSFYDCLYLALAVSLQARLITADDRLCHALSGTAYRDYIAWLGNHHFM